MSCYALNKVIYELQFPETRGRYRANPDAFLGRYDLAEEEVAALRGADIRALWLLGVHPMLLRFFQPWNRISDDDFRAALQGLSYPGLAKQED
ncbi:MAG: hypothetical protein ACE5JJ_06920 [Nitrospinota bacterium]